MDRIYQTREVQSVASELLKLLTQNKEHATVVGLSGDLGAGKTTLVQAIGSVLGTTESITSPTFVIARWYELEQAPWKSLVHLDAYRIEHTEELDPIRWEYILKDPANLVVVEWPEKITSRFPEHAYLFEIEHKNDGRHIRSI